MSLSDAEHTKKTKDNPPANCLPPGLTAEQLEEAVRGSGYPLQSVVAEELLNDFEVTEEWGYIDRESGEHRTLDVLGTREVGNTPGLKLGAALLVECKKPELPYVFFQAAATKTPTEFPTVAGLYGNTPSVYVTGVGSRSSSVPEILRLADFPFVSDGPPVCSAFARAERKGKSLDLSGSVPFKQVVLPLVSALHHFINLYRDVGSLESVPAYVALPIAVIDGPIVLAQGSSRAPELTMCPWVRVVRQEAVKDRHWMSWRHYVVDFVHRAYLQTFVKDYFLRFAGQFAQRAERVEELLRTGKANVPDFDAWTFEDLKPEK